MRECGISSSMRFAPSPEMPLSHEEPDPRDPFGWSRRATARRQRLAGAGMTPAERLAWLEEMLDELLPLVGQARAAERRHNSKEAPRDSS